MQISLQPISCTRVILRSEELLRITLGWTDTHVNVRYRMESAIQE